MSEKVRVKPWDQIRITRSDSDWKFELYGKDDEGNTGFLARLVDRDETFEGLIKKMRERYDTD